MSQKAEINVRPVPFSPSDWVVKLRGCPDCGGRGWFLINPFRVSSGGAGGLYNVTQCKTCLRSKRHFDETGTLPEDVVARMKIDELEDEE